MSSAAEATNVPIKTEYPNWDGGSGKANATLATDMAAAGDGSPAK